MRCSEHAEAGLESYSEFVEVFASRARAYAAQNADRKLNATFGPVTLTVESCGAVLTSVALDPLRHAATESAAPIDFQLVLIDGKETGIDGPVLDGFTPTRYQDREEDGQRRSTLTVNEEWNTRCLIDAYNSYAIVWVADAAILPEWVIYDLVRNILHWLSHDRGFGLFHAAALRRGEVGCLITGKSGSGKSTITAAATTRGFASAGDDFVLVETTHTPRVHAVFDTIKLDDRSLEKCPQYRPFLRGPQRRAEDKAIVHLFDAARDRIASGFPLHVILRARLTGESFSRIIKVPPSDAFRALAPSTLMLLRSQSKRVSANCAFLAGHLQTYAFEIGSDVDAAVTELAGFMDGFK